MFNHHPPYTSSNHGRLNEDGLPAELPIRIAQRDLVPLYEKYGVDLVFSGHDHTYEKSLKDGIYYVTSGGAGAGLYDLRDTAKEQNPWSLLYQKVNHYVIVTIENRKFTAKAIDIDGNLFDTIEIIK